MLVSMKNKTKPSQESFNGSELDETTARHKKFERSPVNKVPMFSNTNSTRQSKVMLRPEEEFKTKQTDLKKTKSKFKKMVSARFTVIERRKKEKEDS